MLPNKSGEPHLTLSCLQRMHEVFFLGVGVNRWKMFYKLLSGRVLIAWAIEWGPNWKSNEEAHDMDHIIRITSETMVDTCRRIAC